ncbi:hypothetical protein CV093_01275 [Oceanobacillus sp. 143]|uniref:CdaA regulatory protein CdaR n=1 Tax=Oceanobacillus zhaokaii TaxID=2052660 RepID=A0A345PCF9_9BACI|nr:CdaR family protein [Oceanobacillus zhaokaii]AXI07689.1 hypothetical protein CUC15_01230 [Oceanobacillus zhaokaii]QGS67864.1 hypothetical protein CV093_01275 [Oceanobacillus sp. 143]
MDNWFKSKWFVRAISLAFAIILYFFVDVTLNSSANDSSIPNNANNLQTFDDVPVEIKIDDENYVVSGVPDYVTVTLSGPPAILTPTTYRRNFDVFVDLEGLGEGTHIVELDYNITSELEAYIEPKTIEVDIEERASEQFQVSAEFINQDKLPKGYELGEYTIEPAEVTLTSSRAVIDQIGVVTVFVDVAGSEGPIKNREVPVNVYDGQGNEVNVRIVPETVQVSAEINNPSKEVPIEVATSGELPAGYTLQSATATLDEVEIFGKSDVLDSITSISTKEIDLSELTESGTVSVELALPDGVAVKGNEPIEVEIELEQTKKLENIPIDIEGLQEGRVIRFAQSGTDTIDLTLTGNEAAVKEITNEDFQVNINVNDLDEGQHEVPITIEGPESNDVTVTPEFEEVQVVIN